MLRGLTFAVALALGTVTVPVHALGLGDIKARSALNQEFNADIDLLSVAAGELEAVRVRLADQLEFDKAGVERPFFLTLLKFSPQRLESGETVIRISSDFPIREPFLDFLVEVNWPRGRLIREYTVLLDPPVTTGRWAPRVKAAAIKPAAPSTPARAAAPPATIAAAGGEYGPVAANETLWSIAKQLRPRGASMHQMMIALLDSNPDAFIDGDINRLRKGAILRVPPSEQILTLSREQALARYAGIQERWLARESERMRDAQVRDQKPSQPADETAQPESETTADEDAELRIATARPEGEGEAGAGEDRGDEDVGQLTEKLLLARENAESSRIESESLRSEIEDMQKRLADMQRLLSLKDEQLAQLQANVGEDVPMASEQPSPPQAPLQEEVLTDPEVIADETGALTETLDALQPSDLPSEAPLEMGLATDLEPEIGSDPEAEAEGLLEQALEEELAIELDSELVEEPALEPETDADLGMLSETLELAVDEVPVTVPPGDEVLPEDDLIIQPETAVTQIQEVEQPEPVIALEEVRQEERDEAPTKSVAPEEVSATPPMVDDSLALLEEYGLPAAKLRELLQNRNLLYVGAGALALLVLLLLVLMMRRRRSEKVEVVSIPLAPENAETASAKETSGMREAAVAAAAATAAATATSVAAEDGETDDVLPDSSFPPVPEGLETVNADVDAIAEADVYIAYGRYAQAEELLKEAMVRDPERLSLKNKLLEVYYATRNKNQYNALAQGVVTAGQHGQDAEAWERICDMGRELDPGNPLYDGSQQGALPSLDTDVDAEGPTEPLDSNLTEDLVDSTLNDIETEEKLLADTVDEPLLDIEDLEQIDEIEGLDEASLSLDELESLELDMQGQDEVAAEKDEAFELSGLNDESLDSLELPPLDRESGLTSEEDTLDEEGIELQLDELSSLSALDGDSVQLGDRQDQVLAAESELGTGLDQPISLDEAFDQEIDSDVEALDIDSRGEGLADSGEVGTKLELARAFVEMGDGEGARDILQEVVKEGNENQRQEAEKLLADIA